MGLNIGKISNKVAGAKAIGDKLGLFKRKDREKRELSQDPRYEIARKDREEQVSRFQFPSDISTKYFIMSFKDYKYSNAKKGTGDVTTEIKDTVVLPIPKELGEYYNVTYQNEQLGLVGAGLDFITDGSGSFEGVVNDLERTIASGEMGDALAIAAPKALAAGAGIKAIATKAPGKALGLGLGALGLSNLQNAVELGTGAAQNPIERAMFKGVPLRDFTFTWKLVPRNMLEMETIKDIINVIRFYMLPNRGGKELQELGSPIFNYPSVVDFNFKGTLESMQFKTSFITSLKIDYAPDGASFFQRDGEPTAYVLSISFKEFVPLDQHDFER